MLVDRVGEDLQEWRELRPGLVFIRYEGWLTKKRWSEALALMEASLDRAGQLVTITDAERAIGCEPALREAWTAFTARHRTSIRMRYMLARSPMLRMAVQTTAMASSCPIAMYRDRDAFEHDVLQHFPEIEPAILRTRTK